MGVVDPLSKSRLVRGTMGATVVIGSSFSFLLSGTCWGADGVKVISLVDGVS